MKKIIESIHTAQSEAAAIAGKLGYTLTPGGKRGAMIAASGRLDPRRYNFAGNKSAIQRTLEKFMNVEYRKLAREAAAIFDKLTRAEKTLKRNPEGGAIEYGEALTMLADLKANLPMAITRAHKTGSLKKGKLKYDPENVRNFIGGELKNGGTYKAVIIEAVEKFKVKESILRHNFPEKSFK